MYEKIKSWLEQDDKDYNEGVNLFMQVSKNRAMYLYFLRKENMKKLVYELEKMLRFLPKDKIESSEKEIKPKANDKKGKVVPLTNPSEANANGTPVVTPPDHSTAGASDKAMPVVSPPDPGPSKKIDREKLPEDLKVVYDETVGNYHSQRALHEKMKLPDLTDQQRADVRSEVVKLDDLIAAGWAKLEAFVADPNQNLGPKPEKEKDPLAITKEINAARKYISVNIPKLSTLKGAPLEAVKKGLLNRYNLLVQLKAEPSPETFDQLKAAGILS